MSTGPIIRIPPTQRTNSEGFNRWANLVRDALIALRDHHQPMRKRRPLSKGHPFQGRVTNDDTIKVSRGRVRAIVGANPAEEDAAAGLIQAETEVDMSSFGDTSTGGIWLKVVGTWDTTQTSSSTVTITDPGDFTVTVDHRRFQPASSSYVTTLPGAGSLWGVGTDIYIQILLWEIAGGKLSITEQIQRDHIWIWDSYSEIGP